MDSPEPGQALPQPSLVGTDPSSSFVCEYVDGINRVLSLPPYLLIDNIARNVELWRFQPGLHEPVERARYDRTSYPDDPAASLLDVDIHAAFLRRDGHELLTVNHFGRVRGFELPTDTSRMLPTGERQLLGDVERLVMAGDCFIGSSPRGEHTDDPALPGLFLFDPLPASLGPASGPALRLACDQALSEWGVVSALVVMAGASRLIVAAGSRLGAFELVLGSTGLRLGALRWEMTLPVHCRWLHVAESGRLWAAGYRRSDTGGEEWETSRGGEVHALDSATGAAQFFVELPHETAWGYGADPIVAASREQAFYVLGRDASLHVVDPDRRVARRLYRPLDDDATAPSLGIGHAAARDGWIYAGFSRGGFQLRRYAIGVA